jgi:AcrR family transcriptional regulator
MRETEALSTKERILDAAEQLFAEHGFAATSLRMITAAARVNLAAVNYHFHSKEALIRAVFDRRLGPVNQERLQLLEACEARAGRRPPPLEEVLEAFFGPALRLGRGLARRGIDFQRLMGRMYSETGEQFRSLLQEQFTEVAVRFRAALRRALRRLPPAELYWRMHFGIGAMAHTLAGVEYLQFVSEGRCDPSDVEGTVRRLVTFLSAGLRAPVSPRSHRRRGR